MKEIHTLLFLFSKKSFLRMACLLLILIVPLASAQVITSVSNENLVQEIEKIYRQGNIEDAYKKLAAIIPLNQAQVTKYPILKELQNSLVEYGNTFLNNFDYVNGLAYYDKALAISNDQEIASQKKSVENEINLPKVIVEEALLNVEYYPKDPIQANQQFVYLTQRQLKEKITFEQGNPLRIKFLWSKNLQNLTFKLLDTNRKIISQIKAFKIQKSPVIDTEVADATSTWYAFLASPVEQKEGTYILFIDGETIKGERVYLQGSTELIKKAFPECRIPLNEQLTTLVTKPDPKKLEEAKHLRDVCTAFNTDAQYNMDNFVLPLTDAKVTTQFGEKTIFEYNTGKKSISTHKGIDYAQPVGTPIKAIGAGKVVLSCDRIISGKSIVIEHLPGVFSIYFHLSKLLVQEGDIVTTGKIIGELGNTGLSTGAHLHFAVEIAGTPIDPNFLIKNMLLY